MSKFRYPGRALVAAGALVLVGALGVDAAHAKDGDVRTSGTCTAGAKWKLKLGPRDGGIETEFEVDSNRTGQAWTVKITDNGVQVFSGRATTAGPSGSFTVRRRITDRAGRDNVVALATFNGQTCRGTASV